VSERLDRDKDVLKLAKHGLSLTRAFEIDLNSAIVRPDLRRDYGELRWLAYGMLGTRMHVLAFVVRDRVLRPISLRRAKARERKRYG
jgi:hypothetical protein